MGKLLPELSVGPEVLHDLDRACSLEWLETNGLGGFASSTIIGLNTRRYHALLTGALTPPTGRMVFLNKLEETVVLDGEVFRLGCNRWPDAVDPQGHLLLLEFRIDPFPRWIFRIRDYLLEKKLFMVYGQNAVAVKYSWVDENLAPLSKRHVPGGDLRVRPFMSFRSYHELASSNPYFDTRCTVSEDSLNIKPYANIPALAIHHQSMAFESSPDWYYNFEYQREMDRGLDFREDLFTCGELVKRAMVQPVYLMAFMGKASRKLTGSTNSMSLEKIVDLIEDKELARRKRLLKGFGKKGLLTRRLVLAADQFIVERGKSQRTIIAGYPWFTDWGRDTMIALPGLCLNAQRFDVARDILQTFASYCRNGLIPNNFPDYGMEPSYNSVDATLWFFIAGYEYARAAGDTDFVDKTLLPVFEEIVSKWREGTLFNIMMGDDGLISAGGPDTQLTWMDAAVDGVPVTPRYGKIVEINALWYNALLITAECRDRAGRDDVRIRDLAERVRRSFEEQFWNPDRGCLYDVIQDGEPDPAVRPNQIFALSLPHPLLQGAKAETLLKVVEENLLTPFGLRSLAPGHKAYCGRYGGGSCERDSAYHQGAVWGWLLGHYVQAALHVRGSVPRGLRADIRRHITTQGGLNSVSEIFEGDSPHGPRGCPAQAWSVAEWLRIAMHLNA